MNASARHLENGDRFAPFFEPFRLGGLELANRLVMAPMTRNFSPGGIPGENVRDYYARRAEGGFGLLITEGLYIDHPTCGAGTRVPRIDADTVGHWRAITDAVHAKGARIFAQLLHTGLLSSETRFPDASIRLTGPSGLALDGTSVTGPMSIGEIEEVIEGFARSAAAAREAGFDGIELHGGHGYLFDQFFWARTNRREDRFGGDLVGRTTFAAEVLRACRAKVGGLPISFRFSQWKIDHYDAILAQTPQELEMLLAPLVAAGVDILHCSTRRYWEEAFAGSDLNLAGWVKQLTGLPTITVGHVGLAEPAANTIAPADARALGPLAERLARGDFDLIAVGRAAIANPDWPDLVRRGGIGAARPYDRSKTPEELY